VEDRRRSRFVESDFSGSRFHGVDFSHVTITDAWLVNVEISGEVAGLSVNGVDVTGYVQEQLDERHPERALLRSDDPAGMRAAWSAIEQFAAATLARARRLPERLDESVDGEWSFLETLRHLVFATDRWIVGPVLAEPQPFHPLGLPNPPHDDLPAGVFDLDARPSLDEVMAVRSDRMDRVGRHLATVDVDELDREVRSPNGGPTSVRHCFHVVFNEEWWHDQYANRDLGVVEH
jgi:hypothetical protein